MQIARRLEPLETMMKNMPPVDQLPAYAGGLLQLLRTVIGIKLDAIFHEKEIAEQGSDFFNGLEARFFRNVTESILTGMDWKLDIEGEFPEKPGGRWVYIMNHPTLIATWTPFHVTSERLAPHTAVVAKQELLDNPITGFLLGEPLQTIGNVGFINRGQREEAYMGVRRAVETVLRPDTGLIIFPDAHRPYAHTVEKERKTWSEKLPYAGINEWMTETCMPRSGGLWNMLRATEEMPDVRFANLTSAEPRKRHGVFHVAYEEVTREEMQGTTGTVYHLNQWLLEEWKKKNERIREWRA